MGFGLILSFFVFWAAFRTMQAGVVAFNFDEVGDVAAMPFLFLIFYICSLFLMPVQNAFSRHLERGADRFSLEAFPKADVFISCMEKLSELNLADPEPHPVIEWFFYDHPAIGKRIQMARQTLKK